MTLSYFDTSILLALLLEEEKQEEAFQYWQDTIRVSSILLKTEALTGLRRIHETHKQVLGKDWLNKKIKILAEYLNEVNCMVVDRSVELEVFNRKELALCRSLDALHLATALRFREINNNEETNFYTFNKPLNNIAKRLKFRTNKV